MRFKLVSILILFFSFGLFAQETNQVEMADTFRAEGKIYVVVAVALIVLVGIFIYLMMLDKKVNKLQEYLKK
jgi:hypothetical protein